jgi:hypothetical protein
VAADGDQSAATVQALGQLATEVVEAQKIRADYLKWKIVVVAALFGTGLGLVKTEGNAQRYADLVLCVIPMMTAYVDTLCLHVTLRIAVIGAFRRNNLAPDDPYREYEEFTASARKRRVFWLDRVALVGSSEMFALALLFGPPLIEPNLPHQGAIRVSGLIGVLLTAALFAVFWWLQRTVNRQERERGEQPNHA